MKTTHLLLLTVFASCNVWAETPEPAPFKRPSPWSAGAFLSFDSQPYEGAGTDVRVFPSVVYRGERFQWMGPLMRYILIKNETFSFSPHLVVDFPAYEEDDASIFEGLGDRDFTLLAGFDLEVSPHPDWDVALSVDRDVLGEHDGLLASAGLYRSVGHPRSPFSGAIGAGIIFQDSKWTAHTVGVPADRSRPGRPAYDPDAAVVPYIAGRILYRFAASWSVVAFGRLEILDDTWRDSPLVEDRTRFTGALSLNRSF